MVPVRVRQLGRAVQPGQRAVVRPGAAAGRLRRDERPLLRRGTGAGRTARPESSRQYETAQHKGHKGHRGTDRFPVIVRVLWSPCVSFVLRPSGRPTRRRRDEATRLLQRVRRIDTSNPPGDTGKTADFLAAHLRARGHPGHALRVGAGQGDRLRAAEGHRDAAGRQGDRAAASHGRRAGGSHRSGRSTRSPRPSRATSCGAAARST